MPRFELADYLPALACIAGKGLDLILVGGQAVNVYAEDLTRQHPGVGALGVLLSKDADFLGTENDGMRLAEALKVQWTKSPWKGGMRGLSLGHLSLPSQADAKVEVLGRILGADAAKVRASAYRISLPSGGRLSVINPFLLYVTKGTNAVQIPQSEPGRERQDARQFAMMGLVVQTKLRQFGRAESPESIRALIKTCGQLMDFWLSPDGAALVAGGAVEPSEVLPIDVLGSHPEESVRNLVEKRLPVFLGRQLGQATARVHERTLEKVRSDFQEVKVLLRRASLLPPRDQPPPPSYLREQPDGEERREDPEAQALV